MGIDIYASWSGMTEQEKEQQYTGFSVCHGHVGYLREAYHGQPYATHHLVDEAFCFDGDSAYIEADEDDPCYEGVPIDMIQLIKRLPTTLVIALIREAVVYESTEARDLLDEVDIDWPEFQGDTVPKGDLGKGLANIFEVQAKKQELGVISLLPEESLKDWVKRILKIGPVRSIRDFVQLCMEKQLETGQPCRIVASY